MKVKVIGGGLAGSEAAWQLAQAGVEVDLWEMRPEQTTGAHHTGNFGELVCSNSLRSNDLENGAGLLKEELRRLNSLVMRCADETRIPAGNALAVDRHRFSERITALISGHDLITVHRGEVRDIPSEGVEIIATGPLTSEPLSLAIRNLTGEEYLYFYDAAAPVVDGESIDMEKAFWGSRYGKGEGADYLNCPMNEEEYRTFWEALVSAEVVPLDAAETLNLFEGCLPVEEIARRGPDTLRFGPLKPVGLEDPRTGLRPWAVVQLRKEDAAGELFNLVGFQTRLRWGEQKRVFRLIPALGEAEFVRLGVMHRNTYINSPGLLTPTYEFKGRPGLFFAGQMTGVEGYVESAASGLVAGINAARLVTGREPLVFPPTTMIGAMAHYISHREGENFQPMNANFGLVPPLAERIREKKAKKKIMAQRALNDLGSLLNCKNIVN